MEFMRTSGQVVLGVLSDKSWGAEFKNLSGLSK